MGIMTNTPHISRGIPYISRDEAVQLDPTIIAMIQEMKNMKKVGAMESQRVEHEKIFGALKEIYPRLEEITIHDKPEYDAWIFRVKFGGIFYEVHIPRNDFRSTGDVSLEVIHWLKRFIDENLGVKKKRTTISKKQREFKKKWML